MTSDQFLTLKTLIATHPSYPSVTDTVLLAWCKEKTESRAVERLSSEIIYNTIVPTDFVALSADDRSEVWNILLLHATTGVPTAATSRARTRLVAIFGAASDTITALGPLLTESISRLVDAGLSDGVKKGEIEYARTV